MALLDMCIKNRIKVEVGHVNYHKRDTAYRDEKIVRDYCKQHNVKFHLLNYKDVGRGNFQANARIARYTFFEKICSNNGLDGVLVAHHKDDLIETYLMQLDKKLGVNYYGLASVIELYGVRVYRPLLNYTKSDLLNYCLDNRIDFGIDESNNSDIYERNRLRHSKVEKMSIDEKNELIREINIKNEMNEKNIDEALSYLSKKDFTLKEFLDIPHLKIGLRCLFSNKSDKFYDEIIRQIKDSDSYLYKGDELWLSKDYGMVRIFNRPTDYEYVIKKINDIKLIKNPYFKIRKTGSNFDGVTISDSDFPLIIRNYKQGDSIAMKYGTKKINRFFIDNKISIKDRLSWPVVINKNGDAILVPGIGCNIDHYSKKHTMHVVKLY